MENKYTKYLQSSEWAQIRISLYESRGKCCEKCSTKKNIQVHHKTYKRLFNEEPKDLILLCDICHKKEHGIKVVKGKKVRLNKRKAQTTAEKNENRINKLTKYWSNNDCAKR